jgi:hypothetical protein
MVLELPYADAVRSLCVSDDRKVNALLARKLIPRSTILRHLSISTNFDSRTGIIEVLEACSRFHGDSLLSLAIRIAPSSSETDSHEVKQALARAIVSFSGLETFSLSHSSNGTFFEWMGQALHVESLRALALRSPSSEAALFFTALRGEPQLESTSSSSSFTMSRAPLELTYIDSIIFHVIMFFGFVF